ncbi:hypothetical protein NBT05_06165 [Aquimarina sp. ERC-38]|uniref:hypothetical protein n=1 Tax=Aquimarina sp. ERC-38 TaxID=2949996 RepID=UPI0022482CB0|nr:hypothetical protein [Aquimarina sp. ERC-38]UZO82052.1 hypothetical protein NBT05_06165 [Aquimarina sp. ERC-38]
MKYYVLLLTGIFFSLNFLSCTNVSNQEDNTTIAANLDSLSSKAVNIPLIPLAPEAKEKLVNFKDYQDLHNLMVTLNKSNPYFIKKYQDSLDILIFNFKENAAEEKLFEKPIRSRISLLTTYANLLSEQTNKDHPNIENILSGNKKLMTSFNSLIIQLNEISLSIPSTIEKELLKNKFIKKDTIANES